MANKPKIAKVIYMDEKNKEYFVPVNFIKKTRNNKNPVDTETIILGENQNYYVKWCFCKDDNKCNNTYRCQDYYQAKIVALGGEFKLIFLK